MSGAGKVKGSSSRRYSSSMFVTQYVFLNAACIGLASEEAVWVGGRGNTSYRQQLMLARQVVAEVSVDIGLLPNDTSYDTMRCGTTLFNMISG